MDEKRRHLQKLRTEQEDYYAKKFRRIFPLSEDDSTQAESPVSAMGSGGKAGDADTRSAQEGRVGSKGSSRADHAEDAASKQHKPASAADSGSRKAGSSSNGMDRDRCWDFLSKSAEEDAKRDAALMHEYMHCARASVEIFEQSMWLKLGKGARPDGAEKKKAMQVRACTCACRLG